MQAEYNFYLDYSTPAIPVRKKKLKRGERVLTNAQLAKLLELWVSGVRMDNLALKYNIKSCTVSKYISNHYLGLISGPKKIITVQSSINQEEGGTKQAA
jgi:hypothetical protein